MSSLFHSSWPTLLVVVTFCIDLWASGHAILYKRDPRAAVGWVGLIWFVPLGGSIAYFVLGINRIQRKARHMRSHMPALITPASAMREDGRQAELAAPCSENMRELARLISKTTHLPLLAGNSIVHLEGPLAYDAMLQAISEAESSITLCTYIFDNDATGRRFVEALADAVQRELAVRVLIDGVGLRYSWPSVLKPLTRAGVRVSLFQPHHLPWAWRYANLRTHRKIMVVDGRIGFTGGMNIRAGHCPTCSGIVRSKNFERDALIDLHFTLTGPIVTHLQDVFIEDWAFSTGEWLSGPPWQVPVSPTGTGLARGIAEGPDEDKDKLRWAILGALACARQSVSIITPYFLPDAGIISALNVAAMRGVQVDILLPERGNLRLVQWASTAMLWQVLQHGCRVWLTPPPFDHSKLMVVDDQWVLLGSANWDPRSLRLNFEFNVECYDAQLAAELKPLVEAKRQQARQISLEDVDGRSLPIRLRDGIARLATPYL